MHSTETNDFLKYENEIYFFIKLSQKYFHVYQEHLEYYDDKNPLFNVLFGSFGNMVVSTFNETGEVEKKRIFGFIESMVNSHDEYLSTATATGLIESIVINAENIDKTNVLLYEILSYCGNETKEYIKSWSKYQGIKVLI
ncbi:MAG: hypothetical protein H6Q35_1284 [Proteobacteria bacterium]|nr:hypothetical protein [Pseudomonadota bacterium]